MLIKTLSRYWGISGTSLNIQYRDAFSLPCANHRKGYATKNTIGPSPGFIAPRTSIKIAEPRNIKKPAIVKIGKFFRNQSIVNPRRRDTAETSIKYFCEGKSPLSEGTCNLKCNFCADVFQITMIITKRIYGAIEKARPIQVPSDSVNRFGTILPIW